LHRNKFFLNRLSALLGSGIAHEAIRAIAVENANALQSCREFLSAIP
jgi:hypothetical protein